MSKHSVVVDMDRPSKEGGGGEGSFDTPFLGCLSYRWAIALGVVLIFTYFWRGESMTARGSGLAGRYVSTTGSNNLGFASIPDNANLLPMGLQADSNFWLAKPRSTFLNSNEKPMYVPLGRQDSYNPENMSRRRRLMEDTFTNDRTVVAMARS